MPDTLRPAVREQVGRAALASVDVDVSPEMADALFDPARFTEDSGGAQAGKSTLAAGRTWVDLFTKVPLNPRSPRDPWRYGYIVPSYRAPHKEIDYLADWGERRGILSGKHLMDGGPCVLSFYGGCVVVNTLTGQDPAGIAGDSYDGICVVEAGQQPEEVWIAARNRVTSRRGWMNANGTLEDDDNHPRWAWFPELCAANYDNPPGAEERSHVFPTWANRHDYPGGRQDPEILSMERMYDEYTFQRRVAGIAGTSPNLAYPQLSSKQRLADPWLKPMPWAPCATCGGRGARNRGGFSENCRDCNGAGRVLPWTWVDAAGGVDFGLGMGNHPATVTVTTLASTGAAWARECVVITSGDEGEITETQERLSFKYNCWNWGYDPMQGWAAKMSKTGAEAVSGSAGSRDGRVSLVRKRHNAHTLMYDAEGAGVPELYREAAGVRYVKNTVGQMVYRRVNDDRTAGHENSIERLDVSEEAIPVLAGYQKLSEETPEAPAIEAQRFPELPQDRGQPPSDDVNPFVMWSR